MKKIIILVIFIILIFSCKEEGSSGAEHTTSNRLSYKRDGRVSGDSTYIITDNKTGYTYLYIDASSGVAIIRLEDE